MNIEMTLRLNIEMTNRLNIIKKTLKNVFSPELSSFFNNISEIKREDSSYIDKNSEHNSEKSDSKFEHCTYMPEYIIGRVSSSV